MTIKPEVLAAMSLLDYTGLPLTSENNLRAWQTIRAELLAMDAEIELLRVGTERNLLHAQMAESRLAAADALLRQATEWNWLDEPVEEMNALAQKIEQHLYGSAMHNSAREVGE